jgi:hypothetical protein
MKRLFSLWNSIKQYLIPHIEENAGILSEKGSELILIIIVQLFVIELLYLDLLAE